MATFTLNAVVPRGLASAVHRLKPSLKADRPLATSQRAQGAGSNSATSGGTIAEIAMTKPSDMKAERYVCRQEVDIELRELAAHRLADNHHQR